MPRASARKYRNTKYNGQVGYADAFALISEADAPTQTMTISSFQDLDDLATSVNNGSNDYADYTIRLTADLILEGNKRGNWYTLTPIGTADHPFRGVFDGQGHTIKNVRTYLDRRIYIQPSMSVVEVKAKYQLLTSSPPKNSKFVDDPDYEWDEEGAN